MGAASRPRRVGPGGAASATTRRSLTRPAAARTRPTVMPSHWPVAAPTLSPSSRRPTRRCSGATWSSFAAASRLASSRTCEAAASTSERPEKRSSAGESANLPAGRPSASAKAPSLQPRTVTIWSRQWSASTPRLARSRAVGPSGRARARATCSDVRQPSPLRRASSSASTRNPVSQELCSAISIMRAYGACAPSSRRTSTNSIGGTGRSSPAPCRPPPLRPPGRGLPMTAR